MEGRDDFIEVLDELRRKMMADEFPDFAMIASVYPEGGDVRIFGKGQDRQSMLNGIDKLIAQSQKIRAQLTGERDG